MADGKRKTPGTADHARQRQRQPPTIDLTATDITGDVERPAQPKPRNETNAEARSAAPPASGNAGSSQDRKTPLLAAVLAGLGGGAAVAIVAATLWIFSAPAPRPDATADDGALRARLNAIDKKLDEVSARPQPAPDTAAVSKSAVEIAALDGNLKSLAVALAGLNRRVDDLAARALAARDEAAATAKSLGELRQTLRETPSPAGRADIERLTKRLDEIEAAAKSANRTTAEASSIGAAVRLALAAAALRDAVNAGASYRAELAAAKTAGADAAATGALELFAATGVPGDAALAGDLRGLIAPMVKAAGIDKQPAGGFLEKLQANAGKLVRVMPLDAPAGTDTGAILARIEASALRNDIAAARAEIGRLPAPARDIAGPWLKSVAARDAAREAARTLAAAAARSLAQPQR